MAVLVLTNTLLHTLPEISGVLSETFPDMPLCRHMTDHHNPTPQPEPEVWEHDSQLEYPPTPRYYNSYYATRSNDSLSPSVMLESYNLILLRFCR
jgi:hypothetical protein